jgi:hypothetical protein
MKNTPDKVERYQFLTGWKEIANYLGKGVRTVQRYERDLCLPVRRPAGKDRGSVVAAKVELDAWVTASPMRENLQLTRFETVSSTAVSDIKTNIKRMTELRDQMRSLGAGLRASLDVLQLTLAGLQSVLDQKVVQQRHRPIVMLNNEESHGDVLAMLGMDPRRTLN